MYKKGDANMFEKAKEFMIENAITLGCTVAATVVSGAAGYYYGKRKGIASVAAVTVASAPTANEKKEEKKEDEKGSDETAN